MERAQTDNERETAEVMHALTHCCAVCGQVCGQATNLVCEGCLIVRYCSHECQGKAWALDHRRICGHAKLLKAQIKDGNLLDVPFGKCSRKKQFVNTLAVSIASVFEINEPSLKNNGKPRGKQLRCTIPDCKAPSAAGVRYVVRQGSKKISWQVGPCASCWTPFLKAKCNADLREVYSRLGFDTDEAIAAKFAELDRP